MKTGKRGKGRKGRDTARGALNYNTHMDENFKINNLKNANKKASLVFLLPAVWLSRSHDDRKAPCTVW